MSINHEAAKDWAEFHQQWDTLPKQQNISRAFLDLHAQLEAKDRRIEALERINATYRECWALTGINTKLDIYAALCQTQHDAQVIILNDVRAAWGDIDRLTAIKEGREHE